MQCLKQLPSGMGGKIGIFHEVLSFKLVVFNQTMIRKNQEDFFYLPQDATWNIFF